MDQLSVKTNWFSELNCLWPSQCFSLEVSEVLFNEKSEYQNILVFKSKTYGNVLVLDGVIQCTERDEFSYQEMMSHVPLFSHPNPEKVLVIGGGDGGVIREVLKHNCVKEITHCEIDQVVIDVSRKYLPSMAASMDDSRVTQYIGDGLKYLQEHTNQYDVIITDSSDPQGPAACLFEKPYYKLLSDSLRPGGIICTQGESMWLHLDLICKVKKFCETLYPVVNYASLYVPTYPSGQIGMILCSLSKDTDFTNPIRESTEEELEEMKLKYYSPAVHRSSFVLPQFAKIALLKNEAEFNPYHIHTESDEDSD